jgi:molecular chaperone DnaK (HSP70)
VYQRLVELQSEADSLVYWTRKALKEHPNWVSAVQREVLAARAAALAEVREQASEEDTAALAAAIDALREAREPLEAAAKTAREARGML